jgi:hypothetical protein
MAGPRARDRIRKIFRPSATLPSPIVRPGGEAYRAHSREPAMNQPAEKGIGGIIRDAMIEGFWLDHE